MNRFQCQTRTLRQYPPFKCCTTGSEGLVALHSPKDGRDLQHLFQNISAQSSTDHESARSIGRRDLLMMSESSQIQFRNQ